MKMIYSLLIYILAIAPANSQTVFNGTYESVQDGRKLVTKLKNVNGNVTGISVFADAVGGTTVFSGTVNRQILTGKQKDNISGIEIKFEAIDNGSSISWEMKGLLLEILYTKDERTLTLTRVDTNNQANTTTPTNLDNRLVGTWIYRKIHNSSIGNASEYEGLLLTSSGICQHSSKVTVMGETSGSLDDWQGSLKWYVEDNKLYFVENGSAALQGSYTVSNEGLLLTMDGQKKYYSRR